MCIVWPTQKHGGTLSVVTILSYPMGYAKERFNNTGLSVDVRSDVMNTHLMLVSTWY